MNNDLKDIYRFIVNPEEFEFANKENSSQNTILERLQNENLVLREKLKALEAKS